MIRLSRALVVLGAGMLIGCGSFEFARALSDAPTTSTAPATASSQPAPAFAAMQYYDDSCAKCHGPQGSFYGKSLGKDLDDKGLLKEVNDMAAGPAQSALEPDQVAAETAFHRSLMENTPYLSVTGITDKQWTGEVMNDAKVTLEVKRGMIIDASVTDWNWTANVPAGIKPADVTITATLGDKTTVLHPAAGMYSHTDPVPPPKYRKKD